MKKTFRILSLIALISGTSAMVIAAEQIEDKPTTEPIRIDYAKLLPRVKYTDLFSIQINRILDEYWRDGGDWHGDMMNDCTAFMPRLLFNIYAKTADERLYDRAIATCNYQKQLFTEHVQGLREFDIMSIAGFWCFLDGMKCAKAHQDRLVFKTTINAVLNIAGGGLLLDVEQSLIPQLKEIKSIALPATASTALEYHNIIADPAMLKLGKDLIAKQEEEFLDKEQGVFTGPHFGGWNSALGLRAYADAYSATKDRIYLEKADTLIKNMRKANTLFDSVFFDDKHLINVKSGRIGFSTMLISIEAFLELYKATCDGKYLASVERAMVWRPNATAVQPETE